MRTRADGSGAGLLCLPFLWLLASPFLRFVRKMSSMARSKKVQARSAMSGRYAKSRANGTVRKKYARSGFGVTTRIKKTKG